MSVPHGARAPRSNEPRHITALQQEVEDLRDLLADRTELMQSSSCQTDDLRTEYERLLRKRVRAELELNRHLEAGQHSEYLRLGKESNNASQKASSATPYSRRIEPMTPSEWLGLESKAFSSRRQPLSEEDGNASPHQISVVNALGNPNVLDMLANPFPSRDEETARDRLLARYGGWNRIGTL